MIEYLTENITLQELTETQVREYVFKNHELAAHDIIIKDNLKRLSRELLQPIRDEFQSPIIISSGYRCKEVNEIVGGSPNSDHTRGLAADFKVARVPLEIVMKWIIKSDLVYGQLIYEYGRWIHISLPRNGSQKEVLMAVLENGRSKYIKYQS
jgi:zinc D-Ala-D-Ala carboxypeptidase